jgi:hypothetical protein
MNILIWLVISILVPFEYNHTLTANIISQMNKSLFLVSINIIVLPILLNVVFYDQPYGVKGLAGIVFDYQFSSLGVGLAMKLIDVVYLLKKAILCIKCLRNKIIRYFASVIDENNKDNKEVNKN